MQITEEIDLNEDELTYDFIRSSGPGGQNVNKVSTAVQLRFDAASSPSLPEEVRHRLLKIAGKKATAEGLIIIESRVHRTQLKIRETATQKLIDMIKKAAEPPKLRRKTKPTASSRLERLESKRKRSEVKQSRTKIKI
jgi:ribosome-associated protein